METLDPDFEQSGPSWDKLWKEPSGQTIEAVSRILLSLLCFLVACDNGQRFIRLAPPPGAETRIRLLTDDAERVLLAEVEGAKESAFGWEAPPSARALHLLHYALDAEALGLPIGPLERGGRCKRSCALSSPLSFESFSLESEEVEAQAPTAAERASIDDHLLPERETWCGPQCLHFETELIPLELETRVIGAVPLPDGATWIAGMNGETRILELDRTVSVGCTLTASAGRASFTSDGRALSWTSSYQGELFAVALEAARTSGPCPELVRAPLSGGEALLFLTTPTTEENTRRVYGLSSSRRLWRFDDSGWYALGSLRPLAPEDESRESAGGVLWLGPNRVLAFHESSELLLATGTQVDSKTVTVPGSNRIIAGAVTESGAIQLSAQGAGLIEASSPDGPWVVKLALPFEVVSAFWPLRDHLILAQKRSVEARHPELGSCAVAGLENVGLAKHVVFLPGGRDFVVTDYSANATQAEVPPRFALWVETKLPCDD